MSSLIKTEEIAATSADRSAQIVLILGNHPSADERALIELAAHKALLCAGRSDKDATERFAQIGNEQNICQSVIPTFIGSSSPMLAIYEAIRKTAPLNETILITGERGTGKELVARALHDLSPRKNKPFIAVNCPALTPEGNEGGRKFSGLYFDT